MSDPTTDAGIEAGGFGLATRLIRPVGAGDHAPEMGLSVWARGLLEASTAPATQEAYARDWERWSTWARRAAVEALPADPVDVANYLGEAAELGWVRQTPATAAGDGPVTRRRAYAPSTLERWVAAIDAVHRAAGEPPPGAAEIVRRVLAGARRTRARSTDPARQRRAARPLLLPDLRRMLDGLDRDTFPAGVAGRRDAALLLAGFAMATRSAELVGLNVDDVAWDATDGLHVRLRHRKNDQDGTGTIQVLPRGRQVATCAPCALTLWLLFCADIASHTYPDGAPRAAVMRAVLARPVTSEAHVCEQAPAAGWGLPSGWPLFVTVHRTGRLGGRPSPEVVSDVVRRRRARVDLDPAGYSSHSLRAGAVTWAARRGATTSQIQRLTGHRSADQVETYRRREHPLEGNAVTRLGL